ncbi:rho GTPase-activating protein 4-like [Dunckerocampus dactyliophorus]|uniref:rho GTPase-activating protein 4-like n=1 Tax=Dunckerocampus dactyliophorus TaxID=161453 RepID=UPI0024062698|nr:rho GTPase-activating protein 4-like [Dunckerocampus dactyliophorus]
MASHVKLRKDKVGVVDYDTQIKEVRCQLVDQLKVLDLQLEQKSQQLQDLADYLRRRGEIESEYSRSLEKLAERFTNRIKRKEPSTHSVAQVWLALLSHTRQESKDHYGLSESCSSFLVQPLTHCLEYTQRLAKKSKDICTQLQDGLLKVTTELQTAWRTYYQYHADYVCAEGKLKEAEKQEEKQKQSAKKLERLIEKRQGKVQDIYLKCSKARNDYLLNLAAANTSMNKYYLQDISTLIDCADVGYHLCLGRVMQAYLSNRRQFQQNLNSSLQQLQGSVSGLDQRQDRDTLLQDHHQTFCMPLRFPYQPHDGDQVSEISAESEMRCELETRFKQIQTRLRAVTEETQAVNKSMSASQSSLLETINDMDFEHNSSSTGSSQEENNENQSVRPSVARRRANQQEMENLYFTRVKEFLVGSSLVSKLQAKHDLLKVAVEKGEASNRQQTRQNAKSTRVRKNPSSVNLLHNQKLFNGDMVSFTQASGQQIPVVVESCIRFINLNGLHHEGIFRVSGSQMEVNNLRDSFERGEDPLAEDKHDLDSVAGVLKLYFRNLKNPLFPIDSISRLLEYAQIKNEAERADQLKTVISSYPEPVIIVMRYLFAFLHHVSQYSDENMMQPYNLAVCFGPSLVRGANDDDVVTLQPQINALVKSLIVQHENIFPSQSEIRGPVYEKCMTQEQDDCEAVVEEGDGEAEFSHAKVEVEVGQLVNRSNSTTGPPQKRAEGSKSNKGGLADHRRSASGPAAGVSIPSGGKIVLQIPTGPQGRPRRIHSPGFARREQLQAAAEDTIQVDKEVCRQMDSVFKELVSKHTLQEISSSSSAVAASTPAGQAAQKRGGREGRKGRGAGLLQGDVPLE